jgi:hypothetical protein
LYYLANCWLLPYSQGASFAKSSSLEIQISLKHRLGTFDRGHLAHRNFDLFYRHQKWQEGSATGISHRNETQFEAILGVRLPALNAMLITVSTLTARVKKFDRLSGYFLYSWSNSRLKVHGPIR